MTKEEADLIDRYEILFAQAGWKELVEDLSSKRRSMADSLLNSSSSIEQVNFTRGLAAGYQYILGLEGLISQAKEQAAEATALPDLG